MISVVIPAYNAERWIDAALKSVLNQTGPKLEVLVIDDGSTDATAQIAGRHRGVTLLRQPNQGQAAARNAGIRCARGELIAFLDADDLWLPGKLSAQYELLRAGNLIWCYTDGVAFTGADNRIVSAFSETQPMRDGDILEDLLCCNFIPSPSPLVRREVFDRVGLFNEDALLRNREDWDMWLRIAALYPIGLSRQVYFGYRLHPANSTRVEDHLQGWKSKLEVIARAVAREPARLGPRAGEAELSQGLISAEFALRAGQGRNARQICTALLRSKSWQPRAALLWLLSWLPERSLPRLAKWRATLRRRLRPDDSLDHYLTA